MPSTAFQEEYGSNGFILSDDVRDAGLGYWLLHHRRVMDQDELEEYRAMLSRRFTAFNISDGIAKYRVAAVQSIGSVNPSLPVHSVERLKDNVIYTLQIAKGDKG